MASIHVCFVVLSLASFASGIFLLISAWQLQWLPSLSASLLLLSMACALQALVTSQKPSQAAQAGHRNWGWKQSVQNQPWHGRLGFFSPHGRSVFGHEASSYSHLLPRNEVLKWSDDLQAESMPLDQLCSQLGVDLSRGLSSEEVSKRLQHPQEPVQGDLEASAHGISIWLLHWFGHPSAFVLLLAVAACIASEALDVAMASVSLVAAWLLLSLEGQRRMRKARTAWCSAAFLRERCKRNEGKVLVLRDGGEVQAVEREQLVVGDVLLLLPGMALPATARLVASQSLLSLPPSASVHGHFPKRSIHLGDICHQSEDELQATHPSAALAAAGSPLPLSTSSLCDPGEAVLSGWGLALVLSHNMPDRHSLRLEENVGNDNRHQPSSTLIFRLALLLSAMYSIPILLKATLATVPWQDSLLTAFSLLLLSLPLELLGLPSLALALATSASSASHSAGGIFFRRLQSAEALAALDVIIVTGGSEKLQAPVEVDVALLLAQSKLEAKSSSAACCTGSQVDESHPLQKHPGACFEDATDAGAMDNKAVVGDVGRRESSEMLLVGRQSVVVAKGENPSWEMSSKVKQQQLQQQQHSSRACSIERQLAAALVQSARSDLSPLASGMVTLDRNERLRLLIAWSLQAGSWKREGGGGRGRDGDVGLQQGEEGGVAGGGGRGGRGGGGGVAAAAVAAAAAWRRVMNGMAIELLLSECKESSTNDELRRRGISVEQAVRPVEGPDKSSRGQLDDGVKQIDINLEHDLPSWLPADITDCLKLRAVPLSLSCCSTISDCSSLDAVRVELTAEQEPRLDSPPPSSEQDSSGGAPSPVFYMRGPAKLLLQHCSSVLTSSEAAPSVGSSSISIQNDVSRREGVPDDESQPRTSIELQQVKWLLPRGSLLHSTSAWPGGAQLRFAELLPVQPIAAPASLLPASGLGVSRPLLLPSDPQPIGGFREELQRAVEQLEARGCTVIGLATASSSDRRDESQEAADSRGPERRACFHSLKWTFVGALVLDALNPKPSLAQGAEDAQRMGELFESCGVHLQWGLGSDLHRQQQRQVSMRERRGCSEVELSHLERMMRSGEDMEGKAAYDKLVTAANDDDGSSDVDGPLLQVREAVSTSRSELSEVTQQQPLRQAATLAAGERSAPSSPLASQISSKTATLSGSSGLHSQQKAATRERVLSLQHQGLSVGVISCSVTEDQDLFRAADVAIAFSEFACDATAAAADVVATSRDAQHAFTSLAQSISSLRKASRVLHTAAAISIGFRTGVGLTILISFLVFERPGMDPVQLLLLEVLLATLIASARSSEEFSARHRQSASSKWRIAVILTIACITTLSMMVVATLSIAMGPEVVHFKTCLFVQSLICLAASGACLGGKAWGPITKFLARSAAHQPQTMKVLRASKLVTITVLLLLGMLLSPMIRDMVKCQLIPPHVWLSIISLGLFDVLVIDIVHLCCGS